MASGCSGCSASASSAAAIPYIGSKISLITNSELRYEGTLVNINTANSTVTLQDVRMSGTENRKAPQFVLPSPEMFDFIVFNGKDIKDLTVSEPSGFSIKEDPAVVAVNIPPHDFFRGQNQSRGGGGGGYSLMMGKPRYPGGPNTNSSHHHGGMMMQQPMQSHQQAYNNIMQQQQQQQSNRQRDYGDQQRSNKNTYASNRSGGVVGELSAQPNNSIKSQVAAAFDFEEANQKFVRNAEESARVVTGGPVYDKKSSFFDNISCETLNRQRGRDSKMDREKQRELDAETFGPTAAMSRGPRYFRRGQFPNARRSNNNGNRGPFGNNQHPRAPYLYRMPPSGVASNSQPQQPQPPYHHVRAQ